MYSALSWILVGGGRIFHRLYTIKLLFTLEKVKKNVVISAKMVSSIVIKTYNFILFKLQTTLVCRDRLWFWCADNIFGLHTWTIILLHVSQGAFYSPPSLSLLFLVFH